MKYMVVLIGLPTMFAIVLFPSSKTSNVILLLASFLLPLALFAYGYVTNSIPICLLGLLVFFVQIYLSLEKQIQSFFKKKDE